MELYTLVPERGKDVVADLETQDLGKGLSKSGREGPHPFRKDSNG